MRIYGLGRTVFKTAGRMRWNMAIPTLRRSGGRDVAVIGCGQFAFATIGYYLHKNFGRRIRSCFDVDRAQQGSFARALDVPYRPDCADAIVNDADVRTVYIASNHATHADYATAALTRGKDVFVEKPVAVTRAQLAALLRSRSGSTGRIYAGYNRPFSGAIRYLKQHVAPASSQGVTLQCFVAAHRIAPDHWYRHPGEGTRICGNVGHWLDLLVHVLSWRRLPDGLTICVLPADGREPDDNLSLSIASDFGDLFSLTITSRHEPFEGINEVINFQDESITARIDDFRRITVRKGHRVLTRSFRPKDVGHELSILQPFRPENQRNWDEVVSSTLLMLHVTDMVRSGEKVSAFSFERAMGDARQEFA